MNAKNFQRKKAMAINKWEHRDGLRKYTEKINFCGNCDTDRNNQLPIKG